jgi:hypothetical protein
LETRSFFIHDLVHFAVESKGGLVDGFYGALARGAHLEAPFAPSEAGMTIETIVGPLQTELASTAPPLSPDAFIAGITSYLAQTGKAPPAWLTPDYVIAVRERLRHLTGRWRATRFGQTMALTFP